MLLTFTTHNEDETITLGATLASAVRAGDILALDGDLGAGKTRLVRGLAEGLNIDPALVASPTYVLAHEYPSRSPLSPPLIHIDAYRLTGPDDLETLGWDRLADGASIIAVEWAARIAPALAQEPSLARVHIDRTGEDSRRIRMVLPPAWQDRPGFSRLASLAEESAGQARCPVCGNHSAEGVLPFCSARCRLADLGKWLTGAYTLSRDLAEDDLDDPDLAPPDRR